MENLQEFIDLLLSCTEPDTIEKLKKILLPKEEKE